MTNIGTEAEQAACTHLIQHGYTILERNFSCKLGEIDIIAETPNHELVFIEVRFRQNDDFGGALASVTPQKQQKLARTAQYYLLKKDYTDVPCRFDVLGITRRDNKWIIEWIENAIY